MVNELAGILRKYCRNEHSELEMNRLVRFAAAIAQRRLWGRLTAAARVFGGTVEQQALSSVGNLFRGDVTESPLKVVLEGTLTEDDISLFLRFQAVVTRSVSQELFHRWAESDPLAAKLWRSLQRAIRHDSRFTVFPCDRPEWVALADATDLRENHNAVTCSDVLGIINKVYQPGTGIGDTVESTLGQIAVMQDVRYALQIEVLFSALREVISKTAADELASRVPDRSENHELSIAVERAVSQTRQDIHSKLDRYLKAGKLDCGAVESFRLALGDILTDCVDGGPAQSYYQYLSAHWPALTSHQYRNSLRAKFEYLTEFVRDRFSELMKKELSQ